MPANSAGSICRNLSFCDNNTTNTLRQIHSQILMLNASAKVLYDTYILYQNFDIYLHPNICDAHSLDFPKFNLSNASDKEEMVEMYKIFNYLTAALGNVTKDQMKLNPKNEDLHRYLQNTTNIIKAIISNLTCTLCKRFQVTDVNVYYGKSSPNSKFEKKKKGCQVLKKYKHFIAHAADVVF
ncbi:hypothetical protein FKM82_025560 [Ascaphus truei]